MEELSYKDLKIAFWNSRSINQRKEDLHSLLDQVDILACVESWLSVANHFHFPGFKTFRKDRKHAKGGGIIILVRNNIAYKEIEDLTCSEQSVELAGIKLTNTKPHIDLLVCYRAPGTTLNQTVWDEIFDKIDKSKFTIFSGDFNAHNTIWNCNKTDLNGERLHESLSN